MKVEAIIIDGKKYVPVNGKRCDDCCFSSCFDNDDDCLIYERLDEFVSVCDLFFKGCVIGEQTQTFGNGENMTRQQLLSLPVREWDNIKNYNAIIVVPTGKKHDSGYALMALVGCNEHLEPYEIAAYCDDIQILTKTVGQELRCDMFYKNNCLRFHSNMYYFQVGMCLSTTEIKIINRMK